MFLELFYRVSLIVPEHNTMKILVQHSLWNGELLAKMSEMRSSGMLCDTTLECCDGVPVRAHSCVLAAASQRVKSLLSGAALGYYTLHMRDVTSATWQHVLHFVYDGNILLELTDVDSVYEAAVRFEIVRLAEALRESGAVNHRRIRKVRSASSSASKAPDSGDIIEICDDDDEDETDLTRINDSNKDKTSISVNSDELQQGADEGNKQSISCSNVINNELTDNVTPESLDRNPSLGADGDSTRRKGNTVDPRSYNLFERFASSITSSASNEARSCHNKLQTCCGSEGNSDITSTVLNAVESIVTSSNNVIVLDDEEDEVKSKSEDVLQSDEQQDNTSSVKQISHAIAVSPVNQPSLDHGRSSSSTCQANSTVSNCTQSSSVSIHNSTIHSKIVTVASVASVASSGSQGSQTNQTVQAAIDVCYEPRINTTGPGAKVAAAAGSQGSQTNQTVQAATDVCYEPRINTTGPGAKVAAAAGSQGSQTNQTVQAAIDVCYEPRINTTGPGAKVAAAAGHLSGLHAATVTVNSDKTSYDQFNLNVNCGKVSLPNNNKPLVDGYPLQPFAVRSSVIPPSNCQLNPDQASIANRRGSRGRRATATRSRGRGRGAAAAAVPQNEQSSGSSGLVSSASVLDEYGINSYNSALGSFLSSQSVHSTSSSSQAVTRGGASGRRGRRRGTRSLQSGRSERTQPTFNGFDSPVASVTPSSLLTNTVHNFASYALDTSQSSPVISITDASAIPSSNSLSMHYAAPHPSIPATVSTITYLPSYQGLTSDQLRKVPNASLSSAGSIGSYQSMSHVASAQRRPRPPRLQRCGAIGHCPAPNQQVPVVFPTPLQNEQIKRGPQRGAMTPTATQRISPAQNKTAKKRVKDLNHPEEYSSITTDLPELAANGSYRRDCSDRMSHSASSFKEAALTSTDWGSAETKARYEK